MQTNDMLLERAHPCNTVLTLGTVDVVVSILTSCTGDLCFFLDPNIYLKS